MIAFLADENLNHAIVRGLQRRNPTADIVTVQEVGLSGASDPEVLAWAAAQGRVLITHDVNTIPGFAEARTQRGELMAGVCLVARSLAVGRAIEDLLLVAEASKGPEWEGVVLFLPL